MMRLHTRTLLKIFDAKTSIIQNPLNQRENFLLKIKNILHASIPPHPDKYHTLYLKISPTRPAKEGQAYQTSLPNLNMLHALNRRGTLPGRIQHAKWLIHTLVSTKTFFLTHLGGCGNMQIWG